MHCEAYLTLVQRGLCNHQMSSPAWKGFLYAIVTSLQETILQQNEITITPYISGLVRGTIQDYLNNILIKLGFRSM